MGRTEDSKITHMSRWLKPQAALAWFRRLVIAILLYSSLVILFSVTSLIVLLNQPYGGFLWTWDNSHGRYRVDNYSLEENSGPGPKGDKLQPADLILDVDINGWSESSPSQVRQRAQSLYDSAAAVCSETSFVKLPIVRYQVERRGQVRNIEAPIRCFRLGTLLRFTAIPSSLGLLFLTLGWFIYCASPQQELNLTFALCTAWTANVVVTQGADIPTPRSALGLIFALAVTNLSPILMGAAFYHLFTILPRQHPSHLLYRTRWLWYGLIPAALVALGTVRFQLGANWQEPVGVLDRIASWGAGFYMWGAAIIAVVRYARIYITTRSRQAKEQAKLIELSILGVLTGLPFVVAQQEPRFMPLRRLPINRHVLLFWLLLLFIGLAFAILRYQVFPGRVQGLNILITLAVAIGIALFSSPILQLEEEKGFVVLLIVLICISLFWVVPSPLHRALRRFALPGSIERELLERFNTDIQDIWDLEALPLAIVQSLERHLELSFAALWLEREPGVLALEVYTDKAPAADLPDEISTNAVEQDEPIRVNSGVLAKTGCGIMLPLKTNREWIGLVGLGHRWTEEVFDESDLVTLGVMANQAALTLQTAQQIQALKLVPLQIEDAHLHERERIARELHDSTQAQLAHLVFALERVRGQLYNKPAQAENSLARCIQDVNQSAQGLRAILRDLIPERLAGWTLLTALQKYVESARTLHESVNINLQIDSNIEDKLSSDNQLALLRICQQALDNALSHAQAQSICIVLKATHDRDRVEFSIKDDGKGFSLQPAGDLVGQGQHGLYIMESRALQHGGHLKIESRPGQGTVVKGYLPVGD
jgi:signal transduction histidine kinase